MLSAVHVSPSLPVGEVLNEPILCSGMRKSSQVLIYVDLDKALGAGIKFYLSKNGVVLTPGDARGFLNPAFFSLVEGSDRMPLPGWDRSTEPAQDLAQGSAENTTKPVNDAVPESSTRSETSQP